jgi:hypothetical protein
MEEVGMATAPVEGSVGEPRFGIASLVGLVGAAGFAIAGVWFALIAGNVSVSAPPSMAGLSPDAALHRYFIWFAGTLDQERLDTALACIGFAALATVAWCIAQRIGTDAGRLGALLVAFGALLWVAGSVMHLGGQRAVGLMGTHGNPLEVTNSIAFTIDTIDSAFELSAFAFLGAGLIVFGVISRHGARSTWGYLTGAIGCVITALSVAYAAGQAAAVESLLVVGGVVLLPLWLIWTARWLHLET